VLRSGVLEVRSPAGEWRAALSPRHEAILRALHGAGTRGLTAAELSRALFGDEEHQVTARAEVSRLRRSVGALVSASPYRLSAPLEFS
jgi:hypothetical protein